MSRAASDVEVDIYLAATFSSIPHCFLLLGGILTALCIIGLSLVSECPSTSPSPSTDTAPSPHQPELPSLSMKEVLSTSLFYKVGNMLNYHIRHQHEFSW